MIRVSVRPLGELTAAELDAWRALESRAIEGNAFMSADFVLPAVRHAIHAPTAAVWVASVGDRWLAAVPVERVVASARVPFGHLRAFLCDHTYLTGPLVDRAGGQEALNAMFGWLRAWRWRWGAIELLQRPGCGPVEEAIQAAMAASGCRWVEYRGWDRATLNTSAARDYDALWSKNQRKKRKRGLRRLEEHGAVDFVCHWSRSGYEPEVDAFLELEAMGWKGAEQSAMQSTPAREAFLREVFDGFGARRAAFVTLLRIDGKPVAASVNLASGREGYGFKLGWDIDHAAASPGIVHEHRYVEVLGEATDRFDRVDATSDPDAFVDRIWPDRRRIVSGAVVAGRAAWLAVRAARKARALVRREG